MTTTTRPEGQELPPLPEPVDELAMEDGFNVIGTAPVFTADQMHSYAHAAIAAHEARKVQAEPSIDDGLIDDEIWGDSNNSCAYDRAFARRVLAIAAHAPAAEDDKRDAEPVARKRWTNPIVNYTPPTPGQEHATRYDLDPSHVGDLPDEDAAMQATKETGHE